MKLVNMHEAKTHLSQLVEGAVNGVPFIIARSGKPLVKVTMIDQPAVQRIGFMDGQYNIPDDFDRLGQDEIVAMFGGSL